ncbi:MAG: adenylate/guanylate cyclase domain-containing protein [Rhizobiaceae bacterium]
MSTDIAQPASGSGGLWQALRNDQQARASGSANQHATQALQRDKQEGLALAVRARWVALLISGCLLIATIQSWAVIYYHFILAGLAVIGWLQLKAGKVGHSRWELTLLFADILLMVFGMLYPNPMLDPDWPNAVQYKFENFKYFYIFLAAVTLGYSWRTVFAYGIWTTSAWLLGMFAILLLGTADSDLTHRLTEAVNGDLTLLNLIDPSEARVWSRIEEVTTFMIVAVILAINSFRMNRLLLSQAAASRERTNLARHFPPNMVDRLAGHDQPFKEVRAQNVVVMFVDIVGFTRLAETASPKEVVSLLRDFHRLVEEAVFNNHGTLDKYLGDGVMVTFGTPEASDHDASNALSCADALIASIESFNQIRRQRGEPEVKVSIGMHFGSVILGDIGTERRLEYATLGDTVNVTSRLEEMTRSLDCQCVVSQTLIDAVEREAVDRPELLAPFSPLKDPQALRGRNEQIVIWTR